VPKDVNLGLYVFDRNGERQVVPLASNNRAAFLAAIDQVDAAGATPLGDAIGKGAHALVKEYKKQLGYGDYRLIVITDGEASDNISQGIVVAEKCTTFPSTQSASA
jgi:Mg-chelatase subunit ChlD